MYHVFCDGSFSPQKKFGVGGYVILTQNHIREMELLDEKQLEGQLKPLIRYVHFKDIKGSTKVELSIFKFILNSNLGNFKIYTDCQRICQLYPNSVKIKGHDKSSNRVGVSKIFDFIDKCSRKELRRIIRK